MFSNLPFYTILPEDATAWSLIEEGVIDQAGWITSEFREKFKNSTYHLDSQSIQAIQELFKERLTIQGRLPGFPLEIEIAMEEIARSVHEVAKQKCKEDFKIRLVGGCLWKMLKLLIQNLCADWGFHNRLTAIFLRKLEELPHDYDLQFDVNMSDAQTCQAIVDNGMVRPLAKKFKWQGVNTFRILLELEKSKKYAEKLAKEAYLARVFRDHPTFLLEQGKLRHDLPDVFIKAFAFKTAADVVAEESGSRFFLRNISSSEKSFDCLFPLQVRSTTTPINSLTVDVTQLILFGSSEVSLDCLLGKEWIPQAVCDRNLFNITALHSLPANELDFARTICDLSKKGRCFEKGWLEKAFTALLKEVEKRQMTLSELLSQQLISRANNHHRWPLQALIVLTFNASAFLACNKLEKEVQRLWQWVFRYADKVEQNSLGLKDPLLERMQMLLRDPDFSFQDLLAQIQISSALMQHHRQAQGSYLCRPTQTDGELYSQIEVIFPNAYSLTLLFPYQLPEASVHFKNLADFNPGVLNHLYHVHDVLTAEKSAAIGMENSVLRPFRYDPRRHFAEAVQTALHLLEIRQPRCWEMGFMLTLGHLSMDNQPLVFKALLRSLIALLVEGWAPEKLKSGMVRQLHEMLKSSGQPVTEAFLQKHTKIDIVQDLLSNQDPLFNELGWEYFNDVEEEASHVALTELYRSLIKSCLGKGPMLQALIKRMLPSPQLHIDSIFKVIITLYNKVETHLDPETEEVLFDAFLRVLQKIKSLSSLSPEVRKLLPKLAFTATELKARENTPYKTLLFGHEIQRFQIFKNENGQLYGQFRDILRKMNGLISDQSEVFSIDDFKRDELKNSPLLIVSIKQFLGKLTDGSITTREKEVFVHLLGMLVQSHLGWDERHTLFKSLSNINERVPSFEIERILEEFHACQSQKRSSELLDFYLLHLDQNELWLKPLLYKFCLNLLPAIDQRSQLVAFSDLLLKQNSQTNLSRSISRPLFENHLQYLTRHQLWRKICEIFAAQPQMQQTWSLRGIGFFIEALAELIKLDAPLPNEVREIFKDMRLEKQMETNVLSTYDSICLYFYRVCRQQENYAEAFYWLEKSSLISEHLDLGLLSQLVGNSHLSEAKRLMSVICQKETNSKISIEALNIFVKSGRLAECLEIFKYNKDWSSAGKESTKEQLKEISQELLSYSREFSKIGSSMELAGLFETVLQLLCHCKPDNQLALAYLKAAIESGPPSAVENMLDLLTNQRLTKHFPSRQERRDCWEQILTCLEKQGSMKFLDAAAWWPVVWKEIKDDSQDAQKQLIFSLANGLAMAIAPTASFALSAQLPRRTIDSIGEILKILQKHNSFFNSSEMDSQLVFNMSKVIWLSQTSEGRLAALDLLGWVFTTLKHDPLSEQQAVQLFNEFLKIMNKTHTREHTQKCLMLIQAVQNCEFNSEADHFNIIKFVRPIYKKLKNGNLKKQVSAWDIPVLIGIIDRALSTILESADVNPNEKELVKWGLNELSLHPMICRGELIAKCFQKENLSAYLDKFQIEILQEEYNLNQSNWLKYQVNRFSRHMHINTHIILSAALRQHELARTGRALDFRLLNEEKIAIAGGCIQISFFILGVISIGIIITGIYSRVLGNRES